MKSFFIRFTIMTKRILKQPVYIVMLLLLFVMTALYSRIPEREKSLYIPVAILNLDESETASLLVSDLISARSVFTFYSVSSEDEMYEDILSGKAEMGYRIPEHFFDTCTAMDTLQKIRVFTTEGTLLTPLANDVFYSYFFRRSALLILYDRLKELADTEKLNAETLIQEAGALYRSYLESDSVFSVEDASGGKYEDVTETRSIHLPIRKLSAFFLLTAALLGTASCLYDKEHNVFLSLSKKEQRFLNLTQITASVFPIGVLSFVCLLVIRELPVTELLLRLVIYMLFVCIFAYIVGLIFKKSTSYYKVLPLFLIITFLFSGILFDLSDFDSRLKTISMFFPPYYF